MNTYYVYIMASAKKGVLYTGITNNLVRRVQEHRDGINAGFCEEYKVKHLAYFEQSADVLEAISREKRIKRWRRAWKITLIEKNNPQWRDLYYDIIQA